MRRSFVLLIAVVVALTGVVLGAAVGGPRLFTAHPPVEPPVPSPAALSPSRAAPGSPGRPQGRTGPAVRCATPGAGMVRDDRPIEVEPVPGLRTAVGDVDPAWWTTPPVEGAQGRLAFYSLEWLLPAAQRAADDGQEQALSRLVDQAVAFHREHPDRGRNGEGWDEGTAMRRLQTLNCLYALSRSPRLPPAIAMDVAVQFGPRYYGPPHHGVHNHGTLANLAVLRAGELLDEPTWRSAAVTRLASEARSAWTPTGTTKEQSTTYHAINVRLWERAADAVAAASTDPGPARAIRRLTARARTVLEWMTEPDGRTVVIGDSQTEPGPRRPDRTDRTLRDDEAGLAVGRWSWRDPSTSYYTLRYGPPRWGHGQQDRGGVTWSTLGARVLVNPGRFSYDISPLRTYQAGPWSHNVAVPDGATLDPRAHVRVTGSRLGAARHHWALADRLFGVRHTRGVVVNERAHSLTVTDRYAPSTRFHQMWHLAPGWTLSNRAPDGRALTFRSGPRTLIVTTTGRFAPVVTGSDRPVGGWNFPSPGRRTPTAEIRVIAAGAATTTFQMS